MLSLRRKGIRMASDERIMGGGSFVERLMEEAEERERETLRLRGRISDVKSLAREVGQEEGISVEALRSGDRSRKVSRARRSFCRTAVGKMDHPAAAVARFLGVTTSAVVRAASAFEPEPHPQSQ